MIDPNDETKDIHSPQSEAYHMPCLVCGEDMRVEGETGPYVWPCIDGERSGTLGRVHGGWNSGVYDPLIHRALTGEEFLQFAICDECLLEHSDRLHLYRWRYGDTEARRDAWEPRKRKT